ncbi:MAG: CoA-binding protein [Nanoarchaeota archaeon]
MEKFFRPKSIAVIGASRDVHKVGFITLKNLVLAGYTGKIYPINPHASSILKRACYSSVLSVPASIDMAVITVPAEQALRVLKECGKKGIKHIVMITAGFSEIGDMKREQELRKIIKQYGLKVIGPNCLGVLDMNNQLDTLFLPADRLVRPKKGSISFMTQSGATGSTVLDLMAKEKYGFAKFVSYGNAADVTETDLLEYLGNDKETKVICMYVESIRDGKRFLEIARNVTKKKPVIILKGGMTKEGAKATMSHTASLAGSFEIYSGAFKQAGIIQAHNLEDLFNYAKIIEKSIKPKGRRVQVITNGGGFGILATDYLSMSGLQINEPSKKTLTMLKKSFPATYTVKNPIDLTGSATSDNYRKAITVCLQDKTIDVLLVILLYQTPQIDTSIVDDLIRYNNLKKKPLVVISMGGDFTIRHMQTLEEAGVPCFMYPHSAATAIKILCEYYIKK